MGHFYHTFSNEIICLETGVRYIRETGTIKAQPLNGAHVIIADLEADGLERVNAIWQRLEVLCELSEKSAKPLPGNDPNFLRSIMIE